MSKLPNMMSELSLKKTPKRNVKTTKNYIKTVINGFKELMRLVLKLQKRLENFHNK